MPLLVLTEQRIAAELRHAEEAAQVGLTWRRRVRRFVALCLMAYVVGVLLYFASMGLTGDAADIALWSGLLLCEGALAVFLLGFWAQAPD